MELVQSTLEQDLFSQNLFTVQVYLAVVDLGWVWLFRPWFAAFADFRLQTSLYDFDKFDFFADVIPGLLYWERLSDLPVAIL